MTPEDRKKILRAHRMCCPYKRTANKSCDPEHIGYRNKCGVGKIIDGGKCVENCWYMSTFKQHLKNLG